MDPVSTLPSDALSALSAAGVDLDRLAAAYGQMDEAAIARSYALLERSAGRPAEPPPPDGDFFDIDGCAVTGLGAFV